MRHTSTPDTTEPDHSVGPRHTCPPEMFPATPAEDAECVPGDPCIPPASGYGDYTGTGMWTMTPCYLPVEPVAIVAQPATLPATGSAELAGAAGLGTLVLAAGVLMVHVARRSSHAPS